MFIILKFQITCSYSNGTTTLNMLQGTSSEAAVSLDVGGTRGNVDRIGGVEEEKEEEEGRLCLKLAAESS